MSANSTVHSSVASFLSSWSHYRTPDTNGSTDDGHLCKAILYNEIRDTSIRIWDSMIFVPNFLFLLYLLYRLKVSRERVRQLNTFPILRNFYIFIYLCVSVSMMRCFISVVMKVHTTGGDLTDKIFWVIVRFFLLSTEISVLVFGLFSGHLDVRASIRRILSITLLISLVYSVCQGSFEIIAPDASFYIASRDYYLYGHGGMIFWFATCTASFIVYLAVVLLPWTPCLANRLLLPTKPSFYMYAGILSVLNLIQAIGALLFYFNQISGLCIVDATTYLYFTAFTPLVYFTFLSPFLAAGASNSAASALVTTTAGSESGRGGGGGGAGGLSSAGGALPALNRPTNLFTSGLRGAVNFSYRPQVDDDLLDDDSSINSGFGGAGGQNQGLHFDHYGPYAYNQPRQGYLVYGGSTAAGVPRNISTFSFQSNATATPVVVPDQSALLSSASDPASNNKLPLGKSDHLLESHMLQEQQPVTPTHAMNQTTPTHKEDASLNISDTKFH